MEASLQLLNYLDRDIQGCGKDWWDRNMLNLNDKNVEELITKTAKQRADLTEKRLRNYQVFISKDTSSELDDLGADQAE